MSYIINAWIISIASGYIINACHFHLSSNPAASWEQLIVCFTVINDLHNNVNISIYDIIISQEFFLLTVVTSHVTDQRLHCFAICICSALSNVQYLSFFIIKYAFKDAHTREECVTQYRSGCIKSTIRAFW